MRRGDPNEYPAGWNQGRVRNIVDYYEHLTDEKVAAEHEAVFSRAGQTLMSDPTDIVPAVRELISRCEEEDQTR